MSIAHSRLCAEDGLTSVMAPPFRLCPCASQPNMASRRSKDASLSLALCLREWSNYPSTPVRNSMTRGRSQGAASLCLAWSLELVQRSSNTESASHRSVLQTLSRHHPLSYATLLPHEQSKRHDHSPACQPAGSKPHRACASQKLGVFDANAVCCLPKRSRAPIGALCGSVWWIQIDILVLINGDQFDLLHANLNFHKYHS